MYNLLNACINLCITICNNSLLLFKDAYHKKTTSSLLLGVVQLALDSLKQAMQYMFDGSPDVMTLDYVEAVAKFRYSLEIVAWLLHDFYLDCACFYELSDNEKKCIAELISSAKRLCTAINKDSAEVIANLLIKFVVRKYGMSTLTALCNKHKTEEILDFQWLVPKRLQKSSSENQVSLHNIHNS